MKEFGGYLPLELAPKSEYYTYDFTLQQRYNSGRAAIYAALIALGCNRIHVPGYICPTVPQCATLAGAEVVFYNTDAHLLPIDLNPQPQDAVLLVNYFGCMADDIAALSKQFTYVIIDNTQSFFTPPLFRDHLFNVYSCRKFIGVADGAYLIGNHCPANLFPAGQSEHCSFLFDCIEQGTNGAYAAHIHHESTFGDAFTQMPLLTQTILNSTDYEYIIQKRRENLKVLHTILQPLNQFERALHYNDILYLYPFLPAKSLDRAKLLANHIYAPRLWKECLCASFNGTPAQRFSSNMVFLPIDQRYSTDDMRQLGTLIVDLLKE